MDLASGRMYTLDELNDAMQSALQRHQLSMSVATGDVRIAAFGDIRLASSYLWTGDFEDFSDFIQAISPDEEPTVAQVIGTALSLLDSWFRNEHLAKQLANLPFDEWDEEAKGIMRVIHERAREHRAFDSFQELLIRWGGLDVMTFSVGVIYEGLLARAQDDDYFDAVADELLDPDAW